MSKHMIMNLCFSSNSFISLDIGIWHVHASPTEFELNSFMEFELTENNKKTKTGDSFFLNQDSLDNPKGIFYAKSIKRMLEINLSDDQICYYADLDEEAEEK